MTQALMSIKRAWKATVPPPAEAEADADAQAALARGPELPAAVTQVQVESAGFQLVEEDDVAFTLALCREIHRIYGSYQDGTLPADEQVWAGLDLTMRTVTMLNSSVSSGMPSMRLQVATAQAREMLAVLFGQAQSRNLRPSPAAAAQIAPAPQHQADHQADQVPTPAQGPRAALAPATRPVPAGASVKARAMAFWASRSLVARVAAVVIGCLVTAVLIDVPITAMALFPNHFGVLAVSYLGAAAAIWVWRRRGVIGRLRPNPTPTLSAR